LNFAGNFDVDLDFFRKILYIGLHVDTLNTQCYQRNFEPLVCFLVLCVYACHADPDVVYGPHSPVYILILKHYKS